jgi:CheY-like chemotaxis protein
MGGLHDFHDLMRYRIMDILLVASPYDSFILEEAGQIGERVVGEFRNLDLHYGPGLTTVASGEEALALVKEVKRFNLVVCGLLLADMDGAELARRVKAIDPSIPVVLLAFDAREVSDFERQHDLSAVEKTFVWQGDARILLAIVKFVEDKRNVEHDTETMGVQVIILIEDNVRFYSSFLPAIYAELLHHSRRLISEGVNVNDRIMRMRARPKILLCSSYEEAWEQFFAYQDSVLGVISDIEFPSEGALSKTAGIRFARAVREVTPDVPILLQSSQPEHWVGAADVGATFLLKVSPTLLSDLREFMIEYLGFGEFVFRMPDGKVAGRADDLKSLEEKLSTVPPSSIAYHADHNHFSSWLKARTEFALAAELRPLKVTDFADAESMRRHMIATIGRYRRARGLSVVADFDPSGFDPQHDFQRIGGGSLGGKARGLAFVRMLLGRRRIAETVHDAIVTVPAAVVVATDVFDRFLDDNELRDFSLNSTDDAELERKFLRSRFPQDVRDDLYAFLRRADYPLAVRSSSLLEDSQHQSFTGVYETFFLPNRAASLETRLHHLVRAILRVYASTFSRQSKDYMRATSYRLEEEKMAVIVQRIVGRTHGTRFYPDFAGVARSHDFYPVPPATAADGVVAVALGLGRSVSSDGDCLRFCPRYPEAALQLSSTKTLLSSSQRAFWALELGGESQAGFDMRETRFALDVAEADGTLAAIASTYSRENDMVYDGISRAGTRLVTFAPILKHKMFPLANVIEQLLAIGHWGIGAPVEIEFAVDLTKSELAFLQLRPLAVAHEAEAVAIEVRDPGDLVCSSSNVLGNGRIDNIHDVIVVDRGRFDRANSRQTAHELAQFNAELAGKPYLLIGVGRWGSADPWLGIPVTWEQISGARVIVEAGFADFKVAPSQGTHFFQNLTSFNVGYFTVNPDAGEGFVDWVWLATQPARRETSSVRHVHTQQPIVVKMNGKAGEGVIIKPAR